jgi:hypothetical protein
MFLIHTRDQKNKRNPNRTPKSPNRYKTVSRTSADFSSTKFCSRILNWTKWSPIEIKFCTHLDKYVSNVSTNFELNPTCGSAADLKIRTKLGFSRSNSKRYQLRLQPQTAPIVPQTAPIVRKKWSYEYISSTKKSQQHPKHKNSMVLLKSSREGKRRTQDHKTTKNSAREQTEIEANQ